MSHYSVTLPVPDDIYDCARPIAAGTSRSIEAVLLQQLKDAFAPPLPDLAPAERGSVESANKLVVERRLKGAGMHWARAHLNPMVALRTVACRERWAEAWPQIVQQVRQHAWQRRVLPGKLSQSDQYPARSASPPVQPAEPLPPAPAESVTQRAPALAPTRPPTPQAPYRPPPDHPWRRFRLGRTKSHSPVAACTAKL